jgi:acetyl-CoA carboxylase carboxyl transferase subunit alpha
MIQPLEFEKPILELEQKLRALRDDQSTKRADASGEIERIESRLGELRKQIYRHLSPWQRVQISRHAQRPFMLDYVQHCFTDFQELKGDRLFGDDASMPGGFATLGERRCVVIGQQKGRELKENIRRNFGCPHPEGYRKALRLMRLGEKFGLPIICLIDTPGAYPGIGAEARHIAEAIAVNLREMMVLKVPIISVIIGEGGSGGALGIGVANTVGILENAYYSVISPEGCAAILWKDRKHAADAAEALRLTAAEMSKLGLVDEILPEPQGGAHNDPEAIYTTMADFLTKELDRLCALSEDDLLHQRYLKFRKFGRYLDPNEA